MPPAGNMISGAPARHGRGRQFERVSEGRSAAAAVNDLVNCHHGNAPYGNRKDIARDITHFVIDDDTPAAHLSAVLTKSELLEQVEARAKSRADIARVLNVAPARITEMFKGDRDLSFDEARKLMVHYAIDDTVASVDLDTFAAENGLALIEEVDLALGMGASFLDGRDPEVLATVPFRIDWLRGLFAGHFSSLKVVRGRGDSMQPTILDGDIVLVDTAHRAIDDQDRIWAVAYGELGMIRRIRVTPRGTWLLMPDNAVVRPDEITDGEAAIIGRVVWIGRRM